MSQRDDAALADILRAAKRAMEHAHGLDEAAFLADAKTQDAVLYQITIVGEAARRVSVQFRDAHPELPWLEMTGMRSKLVHDYDEVDLPRVWATLTSDLPPLVEQIEQMVPTEEP